MARFSTRTVAVLTTGIAASVTGLWWVRRHPSALPYAARVAVQLPHPWITRARLRRVLQPRAGERVLEIGPGTGYYSVPIARWIGEGGRLDIIDVGAEFLRHTRAAAAEQGVCNVLGTQGDAQALPYEDATFDAVCIVATLGEVPDLTAALRQIARVLRPDGRLIVGEYLLDVDWISPRALAHHAEPVGLEVIRRVGRPWGYFAELRLT